jgi:hypothetical protein
MAAITSAAIAAAGTAYSFYQASQQNKMARDAEADAAKAMAEARKKLEINYYNALSLPTKVYEAERQDVQKQAASAIQESRESGARSLAATTGRVLEAQQQAERAISEDQAQKLFELNKLSAEEDTRLRDVGVQLDLGEVAGSQQKAADMQQAAAASTTQGFQGLASTVSSVGNAIKLYPQTRAGNAMAGIEANYNKAAESGKLAPQFMDASGKPMPFQKAFEIMGGSKNIPNISGVGLMGNEDFLRWAGNYGAKNINSLQYDWSIPSVNKK